MLLLGALATRAAAITPVADEGLFSATRPQPVQKARARPALVRSSVPYACGPRGLISLFASGRLTAGHTKDSKPIQ